ncbi:MAG: hypothetical protein SF029_26925 [bacterium]|nr:hypothetical protein [bacterium]
MSHNDTDPTTDETEATVLNWFASSVDKPGTSMQRQPSQTTLRQKVLARVGQYREERRRWAAEDESLRFGFFVEQVMFMRGLTAPMLTQRLRTRPGFVETLLRGEIPTWALTYEAMRRLGHALDYDADILYLRCHGRLPDQVPLNDPPATAGSSSAHQPSPKRTNDR